MSTIFSETMKDEIKARLQEEAQKEYAKQLEKRDSEIKPLPKDTEKEKENKKVEQAPSYLNKGRENLEKMLRLMI